jgi:hypothetical protein
MAIYWPDTIKGYMIGSSGGGYQYSTIVAVALDGRTQSQGQYPGEGLRRMKFRTEAVDTAGEKIIREDFLWQVQGQYFKFYIFDHPEGHQYGLLNVLGVYAAGGVLNIRAKDLTALSSVKENGVAVTAGYTYTNGIGPGGETRINFVAPYPAVGATITGAFTGRKRYRMALLSDYQERLPFGGGGTEPEMWHFEMDMVERPGPDL